MSFTELLNTFSEFPILLALALGLLVAINPCPLAMNIGAIAFIGKDIQNKKRFLSTDFSTHWGELSVSHYWELSLFSF